VFRNEDIDLTRNPEFSSCEFYQADADYETMMGITEGLISSLMHSLTGFYVTPYTSQSGEEILINWQCPWTRIDMIPALEEACIVKFPDPEALHTEETRQFLLKILGQRKIVCSPPQTNARMLDKLVGEYIESVCINPTFIMHHPKLMSPFAKQH
jgi:lysyl-tRNA synthetase class 2